jgi:hypothetical protein
MGQLLITRPEKEWYQSIVSIRNYSETDFEAKFFRYATEIFSSFYVLKFKYTIVNRNRPADRYQPDLLIIAKNFKKWMFIEVELVKPDTAHSFKQIECFKNPVFDPDSVLKYVVVNNEVLKPFQSELLDLFTNYAPGLLMVYDSHSSFIFNKIRDTFGALKICVFEVHKTPGHLHEAYRISGDYPYDITNSSKLIYEDDQHYKFAKYEMIGGAPEGDVLIYFDMHPYNATIIKGNRKKAFLKIVDNPFPKDLQLQLAIDSNDKLILQRL